MQAIKEKRRLTLWAMAAAEFSSFTVKGRGEVWLMVGGEKFILGSWLQGRLEFQTHHVGPVTSIL